MAYHSNGSYGGGGGGGKGGGKGGKGDGGGGRGGGQSGGQYGGIGELTQIMLDREKREAAREEAQAAREREEAARKAKEQEAEIRKQEREEMRTSIREENDKFLRKWRSDKRKKGDDDTAEDEDDWKKILQSSKKKKGKDKREQTASAPIDAKEWKDWEASKDDAKEILKHTKGLKAKEVEGDGILAIAENAVAHDDCETRAELAKRYKKLTGSEAPSRWAKLDILVGIIAGAVEDD